MKAKLIIFAAFLLFGGILAAQSSVEIKDLLVSPVMEIDTVICGDALALMKQMEAGSVDITFTSPPFKDEDIEADHTLVETLADIFGWSLTTEVEVTITATFMGTLTMPLGKTLEDIDADDFNAEITLGWTKNREDWEFELGHSELELEEN
jgi:DNA modification methylase